MVPTNDCDEEDVAHPSTTLTLLTYNMAPSLAETVTENVYWPTVDATKIPIHLILKGDGFGFESHAAVLVSDDKSILLILTALLLITPDPITRVL
jgi:hypothetical protein